MNDDVRMLSDLVDQYVRSIGFNGLLRDDSGRYSLLFDEKFSITLESRRDTGMLIFFAEVGPVPADYEQEFCSRMLEGNYFWRHTGGLGTLALAPVEDPNMPRIAVLIHQTPLQSLDYANFRERLSDFVDTAEAWIDYLSNFEYSLQNNGIQPPATGQAGSWLSV